MNLSELRAPKGCNRRKKRRGRGGASGHGKTSCRGHKGVNARSGSKQTIASEGGQMPLIRRMPKRGFNSDTAITYQVLNIDNLNQFDNGEVVDAQVLEKNGMVKNADWPIKVLGTGELKNALTVKADAFSESAKKKIEQAGGKVEIVSSRS